uniref:Uncharacterized protein n=1 Tax=Chromera velia CCMP2878 TaxID=1169474 RepID=A0A0G4HII1_9ALVE|eukprot:Cvel_27843.t1-p1 / transcript=Cvel_27843.t1 / gene=Cvel_27843 / organism=Chromera_velia_CCMP2878 / gene_product=hypothetical protein / transcript_product=hypothetical protein / location=Cvel_scaffold3541:13812-14126(+) / protein_length=105 / sequence_SO=supercontig / SO=protein_coding / is_pseudo=false
MANAFCGAKLQELVRHGGGHVDIVFDYSELLFAFQDIPIYEAVSATEGRGSEMTAASSTSEENKEGGDNFDPRLQPRAFLGLSRRGGSVQGQICPLVSSLRFFFL